MNLGKHKTFCITKPTNDQTTLYFIGTTLHFPDKSICHRVYTDLTFVGKCNSGNTASVSTNVGSHITKQIFNKIVIYK